VLADCHDPESGVFLRQVAFCADVPTRVLSHVYWGLITEYFNFELHLDAEDFKKRSDRINKRLLKKAARLIETE
jgi:hypothetical protein